MHTFKDTSDRTLEEASGITKMLGVESVVVR